MRAASCTVAATWASSSGARALQLQVKAVRKHAGQLQANSCARLVALHQRLPHGPGLGAGQAIKPLVQLLQPRQLDDGLVLDHVLVYKPRASNSDRFK
jgi:hypothetical protein